MTTIVQQAVNQLHQDEQLVELESLLAFFTTLILKQLTRRVGELSPETIAQVESLSLEQLEALGEALLDFTQADDLITWLANQGN